MTNRRAARERGCGLHTLGCGGGASGLLTERVSRADHEERVVSTAESL